MISSSLSTIPRPLCAIKIGSFDDPGFGARTSERSVSVAAAMALADNKLRVDLFGRRYTIYGANVKVSRANAR